MSNMEIDSQPMQQENSQASDGSNSPDSPDEHGVTGPADLHSRLEAAKYALESEEDEKERMQLLWSQFSEEELNRYEMFRRSTFPKASIKRIMQSISGNSISQNVVIAMSGIAKVFVGELVDEALKIQSRYGESGPIEPKHIREAHRVIKFRSNKTIRLT